MHLNIRVDQLLSVLAITEHGTLRGAAVALGTSQPALSRTLREVERILDVRLFERGPRGVAPTRFGRAVARHATVIRAEAQRTLLDLDALRSAEAEPIRLGVVPVVAAPLVADAITETRCAHPETIIRMEARPQSELLERLAAGHVDLVLGPLADPGEAGPGFEQTKIFSEDLCVIAGKSHPLARRRGVLSLEDLADQEWLLSPHGSHERSSVDLVFRRAGLSAPPPRIESEDVPFQMYTVATSNLLSVIQRSQATFGAVLGLRELRVDLGTPAADIGVTYPIGSPLQETAKDLISALRKAAARVGLVQG
ncbi:MAG: LysR family transcriptional regulator [bacterium]|nr:LysR family transcriptional regulator [bacterium]